MTPILEELRRLSAAEEFFALLDVPCEPRVLNVARLHILRRMRDALGQVEQQAMTEAESRLFLRRKLTEAHAEFAASAPIERRVFKVLQDAVRPRRQGFVPLSAITGG